MEDEVRPLRIPAGGPERTALPPRTGRRHWSGVRARPPRGGITVAGQRRVHTGFAVLSIIPGCPGTTEAYFTLAAGHRGERSPPPPSLASAPGAPRRAPAPPA